MLAFHNVPWEAVIQKRGINFIHTAIKENNPLAKKLASTGPGQRKLDKNGERNPTARKTNEYVEICTEESQEISLSKN